MGTGTTAGALTVTGRAFFAVLNDMSAINDFKGQTACDRVGFGQLHGDSFRQLERQAVVLANQALGHFIMPIAVIGQGIDRDQAIRTGFIQPHEQAKPLHTCDTTRESRPDPL